MVSVTSQRLMLTETMFLDFSTRPTLIQFTLISDARFVVITAVKIHGEVLWVQLQDGSSTVLQNGDILPQHYTASQS